MTCTSCGGSLIGGSMVVGDDRYCFDCAQLKVIDQMEKTGNWTGHWADRAEVFIAWPHGPQYPAVRVTYRVLKNGRARVQFWFVGPDGQTWYGFHDANEDEGIEGHAEVRRTIAKVAVR